MAPNINIAATTLRAFYDRYKIEYKPEETRKDRNIRDKKFEELLQAFERTPTSIDAFKQICDFFYKNQRSGGLRKPVPELMLYIREALFRIFAVPTFYVPPPAPVYRTRPGMFALALTPPQDLEALEKRLECLDKEILVYCKGFSSSVVKEVKVTTVAETKAPAKAAVSSFDGITSPGFF